LTIQRSKNKISNLGCNLFLHLHIREVELSCRAKFCVTEMGVAYPTNS
jgi:hypothetical protein